MLRDREFVGGRDVTSECTFRIAGAILSSVAQNHNRKRFFRLCGFTPIAAGRPCGLEVIRALPGAILRRAECSGPDRFRACRAVGPAIRMSRTLKIILGSIVVIALAAYGGLWLFAQRTASLSVPLPDRAAAIADANRIIDLGPEPEQWPVRLFLPAGSLQDLADTVVGTQVRIPFGDAGPEGPQGFLVAEIEKLTFVPTDFL